MPTTRACASPRSPTARERNLGYKCAKLLMRIEIKDSFVGLWSGKGGFWENHGYEWSAGIYLNAARRGHRLGAAPTPGNIDMRRTTPLPADPASESLAKGNGAHKEENTMLKCTLAAIVLAAASALSALAQDAMMSAKCDDASMMKMQSDIDAMADPAMKEKKEMASKEMMMAKDAMKANKMDDCKMHMDNAMKSVSKM